MAKAYLTEEEKKEKRKEKDSRVKPVRIETSMTEKFDKFSSKFKSANACILHLIKTNPEYKDFKID